MVDLIQSIQEIGFREETIEGTSPITVAVPPIHFGLNEQTWGKFPEFIQDVQSYNRGQNYDPYRQYLAKTTLKGQVSFIPTNGTSWYLINGAASGDGTTHTVTGINSGDLPTSSIRWESSNGTDGHRKDVVGVKPSRLAWTLDFLLPDNFMLANLVYMGLNQINEASLTGGDQYIESTYADSEIIDTSSVTVTFADNGGSADTITRASGDWTTNFSNGDQITIVGSTSNDNTVGEVYTITTAATTVLTLVSTNALAAETMSSGTLVVGHTQNPYRVDNNFSWVWDVGGDNVELRTHGLDFAYILDGTNRPRHIKGQKNTKWITTGNRRHSIGFKLIRSGETSIFDDYLNQVTDDTFKDMTFKIYNTASTYIKFTFNNVSINKCDLNHAMIERGTVPHYDVMMTPESVSIEIVDGVKKTFYGDY